MKSEMDKAAARANKALNPLAKAVRKTPGLAAALIRELSRRTGRTQFRQNLEDWIHPDTVKRVQPRLGLGLILLDLAAEAQSGKARWLP